MKSNYKTYNPQQLEEKSREIAKQEIDKYADRVSEIIAHQVFAVCCLALHDHFGFGEIRLKRLKDRFEDIAVMMEHDIMGKEFTATQVIDWLKNQYGIDLNQSKYD